MADLPRDRRGPVNGSIEDKQERVVSARAREDDQTVADREQTLADADQTGSDSEQTAADNDQTAADSDQTGSDSDQSAADSDQAAADRDQAASDHDLAHGGDPDVHDLTRELRDRGALQRQQSGVDRFESAAARDAAARVRDLAALARDQIAARRDWELTSHSVALSDHDRAAISGEIASRAEEDRRRAADDRDLAAAARGRAAEDREQAAGDREQAARDRLQAQATIDSLGAILDISRAIGGPSDLARILGLVAEHGRALVCARTLIIELRVDATLKVAAASGELPEGLVGQRLPLTGSVADVLRTSRMQHLEGQLNKARVNENGHGQVGFDAEGGLIVPLVFRGRTFGVLVALDRLEGGPQFTPEDERLLEALAATAAAAVASAEPVASDQHRQRIAAAEQERARWARELHDETLQGLAALRLSLSAARRAGSRDVLEDVLQATIGQLETEISSLRALIADLRPPTLDQLGAKAAIEALAERLAQNGFNADVQVEFAQGNGRDGQSHSNELETAIYRIVQESLTNAIKHGHASRGMVEVIESDTTIEVTVRDDGAGFDVIDPTAGFGVLGMRERVELLNGTFEIESSPGHGTSVRATFPVPGRTTG